MKAKISLVCLVMCVAGCGPSAKEQDEQDRKLRLEIRMIKEESERKVKSDREWATLKEKLEYSEKFGDRVKCPHCREEINLWAKVCPRCGRDVD